MTDYRNKFQVYSKEFELIFSKEADIDDVVMSSDGNIVALLNDESYETYVPYSYSDEMRGRVEVLDIEGATRTLSERFAFFEYSHLQSHIQKILADIDKGGAGATFEYADVFPFSEDDIRSLTREVGAIEAFAEAVGYDASHFSKNVYDMFLGESGKRVKEFVKSSGEKFIAEITVYAKNFKYGLDTMNVVNTILSRVAFESESEKLFAYEIYDAYLGNVSRDADAVTVLLKKIEQIVRAGLFSDLRSALDAEFDGERSLMYLGREKPAGMPAKAFLEFLESTELLDVKEWRDFTPNDAVDIFDAGVIDPVFLYYFGKKGFVTDEQLNSAFNNFVAQGKTLHQATIELLEEQIVKEVKGQSAEKGVFVRELLQNMIDASKNNIVLSMRARGKNMAIRQKLRLCATKNTMTKMRACIL